VTAAELTKVIGAVTVLLSTVALPMIVNWLKARNRESNAEALTQAGVTKMFKEERDRLQTRLDEVDSRHQRQIDDLETRHKREISELEARHQAQIQSAEVKIRELQDEVDRLYRRLYGQQSPTHPQQT
jgi:hypothetical protein